MSNNNNNDIDTDSIGEVTLDIDYVVADYDDVEEQRFHDNEEFTSETDIDFGY